MIEDVLLRTESKIREDIAFLPYPDHHHTFPEGFRPEVQGGRIDAVVLTAAVPEADIARLTQEIADPLLPIVSLVGRRNRRIDVSGNEGESAWERIRAIVRRLRELPKSSRFATAPEDVLLAWMYSRDVPLSASCDENARELLSYQLAWPTHEVAEFALRLHNQGFLTRSFFDRIHECPHCRSGRLYVREECSRCRSANILDEATVHHFRCGHIGPETTFRSGRALDCPKCKIELRHIGLDYDKPGSVTRCEACGHATDKPVVGFKCVSCEAHHTAEAVPVKTWYSFAMTWAGIQRVLSGRAQETRRHGPEAFDFLLAHCVREKAEFGEPFTVVMITFTKRDEIKSRDHRLWNGSLELIGDVLHSALRSVDVACEEDEGFLVLMPRTDTSEARSAMAHVAKRSFDVLKIDPGIRCEILDDEALRLLQHRVERI